MSLKILTCCYLFIKLLVGALLSLFNYLLCFNKYVFICFNMIISAPFLLYDFSIYLYLFMFYHHFINIFYFLSFIFLFLLLLVLFMSLESKMLGALSGSTGPYKLSMKSFYWGVLDFMKFSFKSWTSLDFNQFLILLILMLSVVVMFLVWFFLPINLISNAEGVEWLCIVMIVNLGFGLLKIYMSFTYESEGFISMIRISMINILILVEGGYMFFSLLILMLFISIGNVSKLNCYTFSNFSILGILPVLIIFLMFTLIQLSSGLFDFLENESETSGGIVLEFYGIFFMLWNLLEYGIIILNSIIMSLLLCSLFGLNLFMFMIFNIIWLFLVMLVSGVLISIKFSIIFLFCMKLIQKSLWFLVMMSMALVLILLSISLYKILILMILVMFCVVFFSFYFHVLSGSLFIYQISGSTSICLKMFWKEKEFSIGKEPNYYYNE